MLGTIIALCTLNIVISLNSIAKAINNQKK